MLINISLHGTIHIKWLYTITGLDWTGLPLKLKFSTIMAMISMLNSIQCRLILLISNPVAYPLYTL